MGHREPARIEGFSDAVFGFSLTRLAFSLEVPRSIQGLERLAIAQLVPTLAGRGHDFGLMLIYNLGFIALFSIFALLYRHALRQKDALALDGIALFDAHAALLAARAKPSASGDGA